MRRRAILALIAACLVTAGSGLAASGARAVTGAARASAAVPAGPLAWSGWKQVDGDGDPPFGPVTCLSATRCFTFDMDGEMVSWNGKTWSRPAETRLSAAVAWDQSSCPPSTFCMFVGGDAAVAYSHGTLATTAFSSPWPLMEVSCASPAFCVASDGNGAVTRYNGRGWSAREQLDPVPGSPGSSDDDDVSCASARFCVLADSQGGIFTWNGSSWKQTLAALPGFTASPSTESPLVSCVSADWCLAVDDDGNVSRFNGATWKAAGALAALAVPVNLVCTSKRFCAGASGSGDFPEYNGSRWTVPPAVFNLGNDEPVNPELGCAARTCVAVAGNDVGLASTFAGGRWHRQQTIDTSGVLDAVSCPTTGFCAADGDGEAALTWHHGKWSAPVHLPDSDAPDFVSCPSATFCLAADNDDDRVWRYNGATWRAAPSLPDSAFALSCASPAFCVASFQPANGGSGLMTYNGTRWIAVKPFTTDSDWWFALSCPSAKFCLASDGAGGDIAMFNGAKWSLGRPVAAAETPVWCSSAKFCLVSTGSGVDMFNGRTWKITTLDDDDPGSDYVTGLACAPRSRFCVAAFSEGQMFTYNGTHWLRSTATGGAFPSVSCASARFCMAVSGPDVSIGT